MARSVQGPIRSPPMSCELRHRFSFFLPAEICACGLVAGHPSTPPYLHQSSPVRSSPILLGGASAASHGPARQPNSERRLDVVDADISLAAWVLLITYSLRSRLVVRVAVKFGRGPTSRSLACDRRDEEDALHATTHSSIILLLSQRHRCR